MNRDLTKISKAFTGIARVSAVYCLVILTAVILYLYASNKSILTGVSAIIAIFLIYGGLYFYTRNAITIYKVFLNRKKLESVRTDDITVVCLAIMICLTLAILFGLYLYWRINNT